MPKTTLLYVALLALSLSAQHAQAKDISVLQAGVENARQEMERAKTEYDGRNEQIARAQRNLEEQKQKLEEAKHEVDEARQQAAQAHRTYQAAQIKYEKTQAALKAEWKQQ